MIEVLIFYVHIVTAIYIYAKYWQRESIKEALMGVGLMGIMFSVGWVMMSFIVNLIVPWQWETELIKRDTMSLLLLTAVEAYFFKNFYLKDV